MFNNRYAGASAAAVRADGSLSSQSPNLWLRIASAGWDKPQITIEQRERVRRSRLAAYIILGVLIFDLALLPLGNGDPTAMTAVVIGAVGIGIAGVFNRLGYTNIAGGLLVGIICGAVLGALAAEPAGLEQIDLPSYDILALSVIVAASILPAVSAFVVAGLDIALIVGSYALLHHAPDVIKAAHDFGDATLVARPIALQIILSVVAFLWVRGTDTAIKRADRAEELQQMEHQIAEQKRQLDIGVQQILQTHIRAANGDFSARAPLGQDNALWQISSSLNNLLARLQRAGNAEFRLQRTEEELARLTAALRDAQAGRRPIWPVPSGTSVDQVIEVITGGQRRALPPEPAYGGQQPGQYSSSPLPYGGQPQQQAPYGPGQVPYTGPINSNPNF